MKGLTNVIKFDHQGFRTDFLLDIIELSPLGLRNVGNWNSTQGVNFTRSYGEQQQEIVENLKNKTLIITTILVNNLYFWKRFVGRKFKSLFFALECSILYEKRFGRKIIGKRSI